MAQHSPYLSRILNERNETIAQALRTLSDVEFDAIVCTGVSGLLIGPTLAHLLDKRLAVVRKDDDRNNHADYRIESGMKPLDKWIFVDDLIASGRTYERVAAKMERAGYQPMEGKYLFTGDEYQKAQ